MQYVATGPWNDREMIDTLTSPDLAKTVWRSSGATAEQLRREFQGCEATFLAYVQAIHERTPGISDAKVAWQSYVAPAHAK